METRSAYNVEGMLNLNCLESAERWEPPTADQIKMAMSMAGLTASELAARLREPASRVDIWVSGQSPIPYSAWCLLCVDAGLGEIWRYRAPKNF